MPAILISLLWLAIYIVLIWVVLEVVLKVAQLVIGPIDPSIVQAVRLILGLIVLIWIITVFFGMAPGPPFGELPRR